MKHETFKDWMIERFEKDELQDIITYGMKQGFAGLTYYKETNDLYEQYQDEIWGMLEEDSKECGHSSICETIASFYCAKDIVNERTFRNSLVWYAAEKIAWVTVNEMENKGEEE